MISALLQGVWVKLYENSLHRLKNVSVATYNTVSYNFFQTWQTHIILINKMCH